MREPERSFLLDVRRGKIDEQECFTRTTALAETSPPAEPDEARVEQRMMDAYRRRWKIG